jgi:hypothetical protein
VESGGIVRLIVSNSGLLRPRVIAIEDLGDVGRCCVMAWRAIVFRDKVPVLNASKMDVLFLKARRRPGVNHPRHEGV